MTKKRVYGAWAGNPRGHPEDPAYCIESVCSDDRGAIPSQCGRKRGFGLDGLYCKQHDPEAVKARGKARTEKWDAEWKAKQKKRDAEEKRLEIAELAKKLVTSRALDDLAPLAKAVAELEEIEGS